MWSPSDWDIYWDRPYKNYEGHHGLLWNEIRQRVQGRILDMGCGSASCWKGTDFDITGIDSSPSAIREAKKNYPQGDFKVADIFNYEDKPFDTVVLSGIVNYYENLDLLGEVVARLKPKKILITINVIKDFPSREWNEATVKEVFSTWGKVEAKFFEKVGWLVEILVEIGV